MLHWCTKDSLSSEDQSQQLVSLNYKDLAHTLRELVG